MNQRIKFQTEAAAPYVIACAYFGGVDADHNDGVRALEYGEPEVRVLRTHGVPYIDQARAILSSRALELLPEEDAVLVFLDHDIIFHPLSVPTLVNNLIESPYDILGAPYSMRREGGGIIGFPLLEPGENNELPCYEGGGLVDAFGVGMGLTAIRMRVFRELAKGMQRVRCGTSTIVYPFFALEVEPDHSVLPSGEQIGFYHGEDVSFCNRARRAGFLVGLDTTHRVGHKGAKIFALEDTVYAVPLAKRLTLQLRAAEAGNDEFRPLVPPAAVKE